MKNGIVLLVGLMMVDLPVFAQNGIFKCTGADGAILYQGTACTAQQQQVTLVEPRKREAEPTVVDPLGAKAASDTNDSGAKRSLIAADEIGVGMSDTKVLNMRGWGRPRHIARHRGEDGWREEWTYGSVEGAARLVQFVNGKVVAVRSVDALQIAGVRAPNIESQQLVAASNVGPAHTAQRSYEALAIAQGLVRDRPEASRGRERTWQPGIAASVVTAKTYGAAETTTRAQPDSRPIDREARPPSGQDGSIAASIAALPPGAPSAEVQIPSSASQERWQFMRAQPQSEATSAHPEVIVQSSAARQLRTGDDTVLQ